jgi:hypothetical protein
LVAASAAVNRIPRRRKLYIPGFPDHKFLGGRRFSDTTGGLLDIFTPQIPAATSGFEVDFDPDGNAYVATAERILRYEGEPGTFGDVFVDGVRGCAAICQSSIAVAAGGPGVPARARSTYRDKSSVGLEDSRSMHPAVVSATASNASISRRSLILPYNRQTRPNSARQSSSKRKSLTGIAPPQAAWLWVSSNILEE